MSKKSIEPGKFVISRNIKALKKYLDEGGDPNKKREDSTGDTPLIEAVLGSDLEIICLLLDKINEKGLNPNEPTNDGRTPLEIIEYKIERRHGPDNDIIHTMLKQAIELYHVKKMQGIRRGQKSRLESKSLGYLRKTDKEQDWIHLKRQMQASGFKPEQIKQFHRDHYTASLKKKKKKRKSKKRRKSRRRKSKRR